MPVTGATPLLGAEPPLDPGATAAPRRKAITVMAQVTIDGDRCQGHGRCALIAPDVFDVDDSGSGEVLLGDVPGEHVEDVQEAVLSCPEGAITYPA